jgi:hypothetical protein
MTSVIWNVQHHRLLTAASRMLMSLASVINAGMEIFSGRFWQAVSQAYASITFEKGIQDARSGK